MFAELLFTDTVREQEKRKEYLKIMVDESERLSSMIEGVMNLVSNAEKYGASEKEITVTLLVQDQHAVVAVEDRGPGIPRELREKIFDDLFCVGNDLADETRGAGLGLAITRRIAGAHGGTLHMEPGRPRGSIFIIRLPLAGGR